MNTKLLLAGTALVSMSLMVAASPSAMAGTLNEGADNTITTSPTGATGANGVADNSGGDGGTSVDWTANSVDLIFNAPAVVTGGLSGDGGADNANDGGNSGGNGGLGLNLGTWQNGTATVNTGVSVLGGNGGVGSNGGTGGASDTTGGNGGLGNNAIQASDANNVITVNSATVTGGAGGMGGNAGNSGGDAADTAQGGQGGSGGSAITLDATTNAAINITGNSTITGGNGGQGGTTLANGAKISGGQGGHGVFDTGTNSEITIGANATVKGGNRGAAGAGGTGVNTALSGVGVYLIGTGGSLSNSGQISGGNNGLGVALQVFNDTTLISNAGTIGSLGSHSGRAVLLANNSTLGTFHNTLTGVIRTTDIYDSVLVSGGSTVTDFVNEGIIANAAAVGGGATVYIDGTVVNFTNTGLIQGNSGSALVLGSTTSPDLIDNTDGIITSASSTATVNITQNLGAGGIILDGGEINNTGTGNAIQISTAQTGIVVIQNADINGGITYLDNDEFLIIENSNISGDIIFAAGTNQLVFNAGTTTVAAPTSLEIGTGGVLNMLVSGSADVTFNSAITAAGSQITSLLVNNSNAHLTLNENFVVEGDIENDGVITIASGKILTGDTMTAGAGTYLFKVGAGDTTGLLSLNAGALDFTGSTLGISVDNPALTLTDGVKLKIAEGMGMAVGGAADGTLLADDSALMSFTLYRGDHAAIGSTDNEYWTQVALQTMLSAFDFENPNLGNVAGLLDAIGANGDTDMDGLYNDILNAGSRAEIEAILATVIPTVDTSAYAAAMDFALETGDAIDTHLATLDDNTAPQDVQPAAGGDEQSRRGSRWWGGLFGKHANQDHREYIDGYVSSSYGVVVGHDTEFFSSNFGVALAYGHTDADSDNANSTETQVDSYQVTAYGNSDLGGGITIQGAASYGYHDTETERHNIGGLGGLTATGNYGAQQFGARGKLGKDFSYKGAIVTPFIKADYAHYNPDSYTEEGAGGIGLEVEGQSLNIAHAGVGVDVAWDLQTPEGYAIRPQLRAGYTRDLTRDAIETSSGFIGAPTAGTFDTTGAEPAADALNLGTSVSFAADSNWNLRADYDFEAKQDYSAHSGFIRAAAKF